MEARIAVILLFILEIVLSVAFAKVRLKCSRINVAKNSPVIFSYGTFKMTLFPYAMATQGSKLKKMSRRKFATSYKNLVATLKMSVAKLIEAI